MERDPAGQERNGVLRLLSLALTFADAGCAAALSDEKFLAALARFEGALAKVSAEAGIVAPSHAEVIVEVCESAVFDAAGLAHEARIAGTLAIPFVNALRAQVAARSPEAARFVHFGATSQDALDTAAALCLKEAAALVSERFVSLGDAAAALAERHSATPMLARTLLQPAAPAPFGWKAANWLAPLARSYPSLRAALREAAAAQLGGAAGTLAAFGERGLDVSHALARELGLLPSLPWHGARERFARLGSELAIAAGLAAKVARDVSLLMQAEVGEALEPDVPGRGGSSSMPHKRNPAGSMLALEAALRAPALAAILLGQLAPEHERGLGQWQSQWLVLRDLACSAASALAASAEVLDGLQVRPEAMLANLARTHGLVYSEALALRLTRKLADRLCEEALRTARTLHQVMLADEEVRRSMTPAEIDALFEPQGAFGAAQAMIRLALADWSNARGTSP